MGFGKRRETSTSRTARPAIEGLEGRVVPTTFHAANVTQLLADIAAVNNSPGPNTIILAPRTYNLTSQLHIQDSTDLTIHGTIKNGKGSTLQGVGMSRIAEIDGGVVTLSNLVVTGGYTSSQGGGILAEDAHVTLEQCSITGNLAQQAGGGVFAQGGVLNVDHSLISDNTASGGPNCSGGGLAAVNADVTVATSTFSGNSAFGSGSTPQVATSGIGGGISTQTGTLTVTNSAILNNKATGATSGATGASLGSGVGSINTVVSVTGGSVANNRLSTVAAKVVTTQGSAFATLGGRLTVTGTKFSGNAPSGTYEFYHPGATVVLQRATLEGKTIAVSVMTSDM
jgi:hypothetical protein